MIEPIGRPSRAAIASISARNSAGSETCVPTRSPLDGRPRFLAGLDEVVMRCSYRPRAPMLITTRRGGRIFRKASHATCLSGYLLGPDSLLTDPAWHSSASPFASLPG